MSIVAELQALTEVLGDGPRELRANVVEQMLRAQQAGRRFYLLAGPLVAPDGHAVDALLAQIEYTAQQIQEGGARLDGGLIAEAVDQPAQAAEAIRAALEDLVGRSQLPPAQLLLLCASEDAETAARAFASGELRRAGDSGPVPELVG